MSYWHYNLQHITELRIMTSKVAVRVKSKLITLRQITQFKISSLQKVKSEEDWHMPIESSQYFIILIVSIKSLLSTTLLNIIFKC